MKGSERFRRNKFPILVLAVYGLLFAVMPDKAVASVRNSLYYVVEMLEVMPVVLVLTALIETWVPKQVIIDSFGEDSGVKGTLLSFLLGSFSAGPIYAAFPVCRMLLEKGAGIGNVVIILSAWAVIKVPMLANEAKFLGLGFMGIRWVLTVVSILAMAFLTASVVKRRDMPLGGKIEGEALRKVVVDRTFCMGCGLCANLMPDGFEMVDGKAAWIRADAGEEALLSVKTVAERCPARAISYTD